MPLSMQTRGQNISSPSPARLTSLHCNTLQIAKLSMNTPGRAHMVIIVAMAAMNEEINVLRETIAAQEAAIAALDEAIEGASADYQELTRLLGEKEEAELVLLDLMEQWEAAQEG